MKRITIEGRLHDDYSSGTAAAAATLPAISRPVHRIVS